jgi:3-oxoacyl-[acyl-carrier protein] reductase
VLSIAEHLAAEGASVVVNYASSKSGADTVVARITEKGCKAMAVQGNVSLVQDIQRPFAETKKAYGKLDILVKQCRRLRVRPAGSHNVDQMHII